MQASQRTRQFLNKSEDCGVNSKNIARSFYNTAGLLANPRRLAERDQNSAAVTNFVQTTSPLFV